VLVTAAPVQNGLQAAELFMLEAVAAECRDRQVFLVMLQEMAESEAAEMVDMEPLPLLFWLPQQDKLIKVEVAEEVTMQRMELEDFHKQQRVVQV
jgi:hypothetical protein